MGWDTDVLVSDLFFAIFFLLLLSLSLARVRMTPWIRSKESVPTRAVASSSFGHIAPAFGYTCE